MPRFRAGRSAGSTTFRLQDLPPEEWFSVLKTHPPDKWVSLLQAVPAEDWFFVLHVLLIRDQDLDNLAKDRQAQDHDPQKAPIAFLEGHEHRTLRPLLKLFRKYNCPGYSQCLVGPVPPLPYDPGPEVETAALRAVIEWLAPALAFPRYTTPKEQQELVELRRRLARAAEDRLRELQPAPSALPAARSLSDTERRILSHCRRQAHKGERIARWLGLSFDHVRRLLARLVREGRLRRTDRGYRTVLRAT